MYEVLEMFGCFNVHISFARMFVRFSYRLQSTRHRVNSSQSQLVTMNSSRG